MKTLFSLIVLTAALGARAETLEMTCYLNNLEKCQGCGFLEIQHDLDTDAYRFYERGNGDPSKAFGQSQAFRQVKTTTTSDGKLLSISGWISRDIRKALDYPGITTIARVKLSIEPAPAGQEGRVGGPYIGTVRYQAAGITLLKEKAECYEWSKL
jgi:hypothetical protein